jgi:hypothetical protein
MAGFGLPLFQTGAPVPMTPGALHHPGHHPNNQTKSVTMTLAVHSQKGSDTGPFFFNFGNYNEHRHHSRSRSRSKSAASAPAGAAKAMPRPGREEVHAAGMGDRPYEEGAPGVHHQVHGEADAVGGGGGPLVHREASAVGGGWGPWFADAVGGGDGAAAPPAGDDLAREAGDDEDEGQFRLRLTRLLEGSTHSQMEIDSALQDWKQITRDFRRISSVDLPKLLSAESLAAAKSGLSPRTSDRLFFEVSLPLPFTPIAEWYYLWHRSTTEFSFDLLPLDEWQQETGADLSVLQHSFTSTGKPPLFWRTRYKLVPAFD